LQFGLQLASRLTPQCLADLVGRVGHHLGQYMRIPGRHGDLGVAEYLHHYTLVDALGKQQRGRGVPCVVYASVADSSDLEERFPLVLVGVGADRMTIGLAPDESAVVPGWPGSHALLELRGPVRFERRR
jgi:hypothetical protein